MSGCRKKLHSEEREKWQTRERERRALDVLSSKQVSTDNQSSVVSTYFCQNFVILGDLWTFADFVDVYRRLMDYDFGMITSVAHGGGASKKVAIAIL